jgi:hypothetical protein
MATPFDNWTLEDVEEEIGEELARQSLRFTQGRVGEEVASTANTNLANPIDINRAFVDGNHWQGGDGWIGPHPQQGDTGYDVTMQELEKAFTSRNAILEVVQRHGAGLLGREPHWTLAPRRPMKQGAKPDSGEQTLIDEGEQYLTEWWDKRKVHSHLQEAVTRSTWAERSAVRLYIPEGLLVDVKRGRKSTRIATATSIEDALDMIYVATPMYNEAVIVTDERTQMQCGILRYRFEDEEADEEIEVAELTYLDGEYTVIRTIEDRDDDSTPRAPFRMKLGKRLTLFEMRRRLLITQQVQQMQRALNLAISMLPRNVVTGGFLERVLLNAQMPGKWIEDEETGNEKFIPGEYVTGAGTTNFVEGTKYTDEDTGKTVIATPQVKFREPVDPKSAISAAAEHYQEILHECDQMHVLTVSDGRIGWQSREQARADFEQSLRFTQSEAEALGRWTLETALALAEVIANQPGHYTKSLRAVFQCRTDTGPVDAQERKQNDESYKTGTMSLETTMQRNNIMDPEAEQQAIAAQPGGDLGILEKRAAIFATLAAVADAHGAALVAGFTAAQATQLAAVDSGMTQDGTDPNARNVDPTGNGQPGGNGASGDGNVKPKAAPGTKPIRQPIRLPSDRIPRETV